MPSQDKLIKQGILLTDNLFDEIAKRLSRGVKASDTLEAFLNQTKEYTTNSPLVLNGYKDKMLELILQETNNHKFSRPAQRELTRATIEKRVGDRIVDVGEDIVQSVRDIVKWGYNNNKSQDEIADEITHRVDVIKNTRARTIARTEVARTATASDYVINKERGATHFTVDCRDTCCPICRKDYNFGNVEYTIDQVEMLPPRHPNCYDRETKVYTINGWKYFKDLSDDDLLLSMNPKGNELEFIKPIRLIKYKNTDKKLYHIHNRWFDVCVTEDHDCFIHQRRDGGSKGRYLEPQFRKPSELTSESKFIRCIDVDRENPKVVNINGLEFEPKDFAFFMAWFISEGSVLHNPETAKQHGYPVKITQEIGENREVLERELQRIFGYLGFRVAIGKSYFEVYSKQLYDYLLPLGYSNKKYIPSEVFTLNKECLNIFLDNYVLGDGHERVSDNELVQNSSERALFTSSPRLRDDLSYLVLLCGYYPSISLHTPKGKVSAHKNGTYVQNNTVFRIAVNKSKHTNYSGCTVDLIEYNDYVYCAELPKWHTLWVMRNGKTSWNGNCRCYARYSIKGGSEVKARKTPYPVQTSTEGNTSATRQTTTTRPKETNSEYSKLANRYDDITFEETTEEHYIYRNNVDGTSIKFERAVPLSDIQSHLDFYDSLEWVLKRSTREVVFVEEPTENSNNMGLNHHGRMVEIFLGNIKNHEQGKLQGVKFVIAHELFHSVDINSKTSLGGKEFSLKRVWQKAITEDDKNFKAQGITAQYGNVNPIEHSPTAGSNVTYELFFGTERTRAMEDIADSIGVQFMEPNEKIGTDLGMLTKEEWNKTFPNRAKLAQDILKDPIKYGLDNSIMLGAYGETSEKKEAQPKPTSDDNKTQIERINRRIKSYEKSIEKFSKIDKKIAKMYQGRLDKAKKQLSELQGE